MSTAVASTAATGELVRPRARSYAARFKVTCDGDTARITPSIAPHWVSVTLFGVVWIGGYWLFRSLFLSSPSGQQLAHYAIWADFAVHAFWALFAGGLLIQQLFTPEPLSSDGTELRSPGARWATPQRDVVGLAVVHGSVGTPATRHAQKGWFAVLARSENDRFGVMPIGLVSSFNDAGTPASPTGVLRAFCQAADIEWLGVHKVGLRPSLADLWIYAGERAVNGLQEER